MPEPSSTYVFATAPEFRAKLEEIEGSISLQYVLRGSFRDDVIQSYAFNSVPNLGIPESGDYRVNPTYLVMGANSPVRSRVVPQRRGDVRYLVDTVANPSAMLFTPGGLYGDGCLIVTEVMGTSDPRSFELYRFFVSILTRGFQRHGHYQLSPDAVRLAKEGKRLTHNSNWDRDHDFKVPLPGIE